MHGLFIVAERAGLHGLLQKCWRPVRHCYLLLFIVFSWVVFRADSLAQVGPYFKALCGQGPGGQSLPVLYLLNPEVGLSLLLGVVLAIPWPLRPWTDSWRGGAAMPSGVAAGRRFAMAAAHGLVFLLCLLSLSVNAYNPFIYFRF